MIPIVAVPKAVLEWLEPYREMFAREAGFQHVARYITGLLSSPNKTLQGIHALQIWPEGESRSRRAMHEAVMEGAWAPRELLRLHQKEVEEQTRSKGKRILWLDWTFLHHARGPKIWGNEKRYDYVEKRTTHYQVLSTCGVSTPNRVDCLDVEVQAPRLKEEEEFMRQTAKPNYEALEAARERLLDLLAYHSHQERYQTRTDMAAAMIRQLESEGGFEDADYAFDNGLFCKQVVAAIEEAGKEWVSELETSRKVLWKDQWVRLDEVAKQLRTESPRSFREYECEKRNGEKQKFWAFTKVVHLKRYGRKRIMIMHYTEELSDEPHFYITSGISWKPPRILRTWSFRWGAELFHEFAKQAAGLEDSQCRKEESVQRHTVLCCLAQSLLQSLPCSGATSEKFAWANGNETLGQRSHTLIRQLFAGILELAKNLWGMGRSNEEILNVLLPA